MRSQSHLTHSMLDRETFDLMGSMTQVDVFETFRSIQGESTYAGLPCFFIRLAGCNLRCVYCDTREAFEPGRRVAIAELVAGATLSSAPLVEITGGEPLLQAGFENLATALRDRTGKTILVETNGSCDISVIPERIVAIMDIKCPGSGETDAMDMANMERLRRQDEVKFVLRDRADYDWARGIVQREGLADRCHAVFFVPVQDDLSPAQLADWLLADSLDVRLGLQLHKVIGVR